MPRNPDLLCRALWITGPGQAEIRTASLLPAGEGMAQVKALQSGISRGTEALVFAGKVPLSEWERMRCPFQAGDFPYPVKYGYAMVGRVVAGSTGLAGRRVFCLYPHQDRFSVPEAALTPIPDHIPTARAVLACQIETALNAAWDAAPRIGDRIAVVGGGAIGCLVAWLCKGMTGVEVTLIDRDPGRGAIAAALGFGFAHAEAAHAQPATTGCDLVFHASGSNAGLVTALSLAGFEAEIIEMSWYGDTPVMLPLGAAFHSQRLSLRSSQVGAVSPSRRARWDHARRMALAVSLAADPRLDILVREATAFDRLPEALPNILETPGSLCHRVIYQEE